MLEIIKLIFALLITSSSFSQIIKIDIGSYSQFDALGGYDVGAMIHVDKGVISSDQFPRSDLFEVIFDKRILKTRSLGNLPYYEFDMTKTEKARLGFRLNSISDVDANIESAIKNMETVTMKVNKGKRVVFNGGGNTFNRMIRVLPNTEVCDMYQYASNNKVRFVTEILRFDSAEITYYWGLNIDIDSDLKIKEILGIKGNYSLDDNGNLLVKYVEPVNVGYKYNKVSGSLKKSLKKYCEDVRVVFKDSDGDSFGDSNNIKQIPIDDPTPTGYVDIGGDCCDADNRVFPGHSKYFTSPSICQSFDYNCDGDNSKKFGGGGGCVSGCRQLNSGYIASVPDCGSEAAYATGCDNGNALNRNCTVHNAPKAQECR